MSVKRVFASLVLAVAAMAAGGSVQAKGCIKGAVVGGAAGHMDGHHGAIGAAMGCAVGHHNANKQQQHQGGNSQAPSR